MKEQNDPLVALESSLLISFIPIHQHSQLKGIPALIINMNHPISNMLLAIAVILMAAKAPNATSARARLLATKYNLTSKNPDGSPVWSVEDIYAPNKNEKNAKKHIIHCGYNDETKCDLNLGYLTKTSYIGHVKQIHCEYNQDLFERKKKEFETS